jgi:uncharacterized glyoxalase superfamily protein PhnB
MDTQVSTAQVLYPAMRYDDAHGAIRWLCDAFGFVERVVYDGPDGTVAHAELSLDGNLIMLGSARKGGDYPATTPRELGGITGSIYAYVADPDAHCKRARTAGAEITVEPRDTEYGSREYAVRDCEGYWWSFGTYRP